MAFATSEWQLYVGMVFGILSFCVTTLCRSIMSKLVEPHEVGKVFAVVGAIQVSIILKKNWLIFFFFSFNILRYEFGTSCNTK